MNILLCCEHFHPSVGGVQKTIYELGLRFVLKGHKVLVATSWSADRQESSVDGIDILGFKVYGNAASGMKGEIERYHNFLIHGNFDFLLVMAAQQWTFDAMIPILDKIHYKKLHIPCGYSGFYQRKYRKYYKYMDTHLRKFNYLIYNSTDYRDINYARDRGVPNINIIPAGASELEFVRSDSSEIVEKLGIDKNAFIYLSVGSPAYNKGHKEILQSYLLVNLPFDSVLVLNGDYANPDQEIFRSDVWSSTGRLKELAKRALGKSTFNILKLANSNGDKRKKIIFSNLERTDLIQLFFCADLFLFASHIEYSPLVIFECLAAGLPFLSIPVGNVEEIVKWSDGGIICDGHKSDTGFSSVDPLSFSKAMQELSLDKEKADRLSASGHQSWQDKFTWGKIASQIEALVKHEYE